MKEINIMKKLSKSHIVKYYDSFIYDDILHEVLKFYDTNLYRYYKQNSRY